MMHPDSFVDLGSLGTKPRAMQLCALKRRDHMLSVR